MVDKMTADDIRLALLNKYEKENFVCFTEFRTSTGYLYKHNYVDFLAVGLWNGDNIVGFEIKVSRQDFLTDIRSFKTKQQTALDGTEQFYYICPVNMIDKDEVPENVGLCWVNKGLRIIVKKEAKFREKKDLPAQFVKSLMRANTVKILRTGLPIKYSNREMTEKEFRKIVKKEVEKEIKYGLDCRVRDGVDKRVGEIEKEIGFDRKAHKLFKNILGHNFMNDSVKRESLYILEFLSDLNRISELFNRVNRFSEYLSSFIKLLKESKDNE